MKLNSHHNYHQIKTYTLYPESELKKCSEDVCNYITNFDSLNLIAVINKYSAQEFLEVSKLKLL